MKNKIFKINKEDPIEVGSVVRFKSGNTRQVGEVFSIVEGRGKPGYEVILYDKRLRPMFRGDGTYKIKRVLAEKCKLIDENFKFKFEQNYEIGDVCVIKLTVISAMVLLLALPIQMDFSAPHMRTDITDLI